MSHLFPYLCGTPGISVEQGISHGHRRDVKWMKSWLEKFTNGMWLSVLEIAVQIDRQIDKVDNVLRRHWTTGKSSGSSRSGRALWRHQWGAWDTQALEQGVETALLLLWLALAGQGCDISISHLTMEWENHKAQDYGEQLYTGHRDLLPWSRSALGTLQ